MTLARRVLGIDYGSVRIGVAVSDPLNIIARALETLPNDPGAVARIAALAVEFDAGAVVVGMPLTLRGEEGAKAQEVAAFVAALRAALACEVTTLDERFTSRLAQQAIRSSGAGKKARREKGLVDRTAAALLLQDYLDGARTPH